MTVTQARRNNIAKAREVLAAKRAAARVESRRLLQQTAASFASLAQAGTVPVPDAEVAVTLQMLQATIDQAGWQLNVIRQRMGGLL